MTANTIIRLALQEIGVLDPVETATAEDAQDSLVRLNLLAESLQLDRGWLFQEVRTVFPLAANVQSYTIGTGGQINIPRPDFAPTRAGIIIDTASATLTELGIEVLTPQRYDGIAQKTLASTLSRGVYYDFSLAAPGLGRVLPWPVPSVGTTALVLYLPGVAVGQFATLHVNYLLAPGYGRALYTALAIEVCPTYGRVPSGVLVDKARHAKELIDRANDRTPEMRCDQVAALTTDGPYGWDYRLGDYR